MLYNKKEMIKLLEGRDMTKKKDVYAMFLEIKAKLGIESGTSLSDKQAWNSLYIIMISNWKYKKEINYGKGVELTVENMLKKSEMIKEVIFKVVLDLCNTEEKERFCLRIDKFTTFKAKEIKGRLFNGVEYPNTWKVKATNSISLKRL